MARARTSGAATARLSSVCAASLHDVIGKLGVLTRAEAVQVARDNGWLYSDPLTRCQPLWLTRTCTPSPRPTTSPKLTAGTGPSAVARDAPVGS